MTDLPRRTLLVSVGPQILSYYKDRAGGRTPLIKLAAGRMTCDATGALLLLHKGVSELGGTLLITDAYRSAQVQRAARAKYETWLAAGKPSPRTDFYNKKTMKAAFVSRPGRSFHNAGRAIDIAHMYAAPESVPRDKKLDWLWDVAKPLGWRPIIKAPNESQSEAWHFDFMGPWASTYDRLGYGQAAMCAVLDLGHGIALYSRPWKRWVQAQIHRAGQDIGDVDGLWGKRTRGGAEALGVERLLGERIALSEALCALITPPQPSSVAV